MQQADRDILKSFIFILHREGVDEVVTSIRDLDLNTFLDLAASFEKISKRQSKLAALFK